MQSMSAISSLSDFSSLPGIASGPVALYGLMSFSNLRTPFLFTMIGLTLGWLADFILGMFVVSSTVNTEVNWSLSMLDFFPLSLWLIPLDCKGTTPLASHFLLFIKLYSFLEFPVWSSFTQLLT